MGSNTDSAIVGTNRQKRTRSCLWGRYSERGQSIIETAVIMPVILLVIAGVLDFGRVVHTYVVVVNAAREAAIAGAVTQLSTSQLQTFMNEELARGGVHNGTPSFTVSYQSKGSPAKQTLIIDLSYNIPLVILFLPFPAVTVRSHAEMITFWN